MKSTGPEDALIYYDLHVGRHGGMPVIDYRSAPRLPSRLLDVMSRGSTSAV